MSTSHAVSRKFTATLAIIFFLPPLILFIIWSSIGLQYGAMSEAQKARTFLDYFPGWLQNFTGIHIFALACCVAAILLARRSFKKKLLSIRVLMLLVVICSVFLILFNIFQIIGAY